MSTQAQNQTFTKSVKCPLCEQQTDPGNMTIYRGETICEGCAEGKANANYYDDPHGKNWN